MSTLPMPGGKSPLMIGAIVVAALWMYSRRAGAATPVAGGRRLTTPGRINNGQPYATPTAVAGQLAAGVVGLIRGIGTQPTKGIAVGDVTARDAIRAAERAADPSYYGWSGPNDSDTGGGGISWPFVDGMPSAPVYDPSTFTLNPGDNSTWFYNPATSGNSDPGSFWGIE